MDVVDLYLPLAWLMLRLPLPHTTPEALVFVRQLVHHSQLLAVNLVISLYYLYKLGGAKVDHDPLTHAYLVVVSLILLNKVYDDQCYTLKTWHNIVNNCHTAPVVLDLDLLNAIEHHVLSALDYDLGFHKMPHDYDFWHACYATAAPQVVAKLRGLVVLEPAPPVAVAPAPITPPLLSPLAPMVVPHSVPVSELSCYGAAPRLVPSAYLPPQPYSHPHPHSHSHPHPYLSYPLTPPSDIAKPQWVAPTGYY